jgi:hypothetical protein
LPKYSGTEVEIRIAATEVGLDTASPLTNIESIEWNVAQNVERLPKGLGFRSQEVREGLAEISGTISRWHDEIAVAGYSNFRTAVGAFQVDTVINYLFVEVKNKSTGKKVRFKNCKGDYSAPAVATDGYMMEQWDFSAEDIAET